MKALGILMVILGAGLASAMGARNPDTVVERQEMRGRSALLQGEVARLTKLVDEPGSVAPAEIAAAKDKLAAIAPRATEAAASVAQIPADAVPASERLGDWFNAAGLPFIGGILLVIAGALLVRRTRRLEGVAADAAGASGQGKAEAVDFGVKLGETVAAVKGLHARVAGLTPRPEELESIKLEIEAIQRDAIEPMVETREQLIRRYGMAGFAQVFGPLSAGERLLNRAWVALVDRHWGEMQLSLEAAAHHLEQTHEELAKLTAKSAG